MVPALSAGFVTDATGARRGPTVAGRPSPAVITSPVIRVVALAPGRRAAAGGKSDPGVVEAPKVFGGGKGVGPLEEPFT